MIRHYSEVYDMNTKVDEMTILGIHTPQANALKKMFKGHFLNYKKYKVLGCSIRMACASTLPLNAEQIGLEAGEIDPRDVMNPMLFKACTGDNLNALLNQIYNRYTETATTGAVSEHKITNAKSLDAYYQLLSDPTWRKAHPQAGLFIKNLKPFVHKVATTQPFKWQGMAGSGYSSGVVDRPNIGIAGTVDATSNPMGFGSPGGKEYNSTNKQFDGINPSVFVSNGVSPMPWLDTACPQTVPTFEAGQSSTVSREAIWLINNIPRVYMGCLVMPPAKSTKFYMRMVIDWKIAFKDWRPSYEIGGIESMVISEGGNGITDGIGPTGTTYFDLMNDNATKEMMEDEQSSFSSNGADSDMVFSS